jgi:sugar phosphate isomerase/epimerase
VKLAISNIAWDRHDDPEILTGLTSAGVKGIEIAPTKIWPEWKGAGSKQAAIYKQHLSSLGLEIPAMQAILFGRPELQLFDPGSHGVFLDHMKSVADLAAGFGAGVLVFGAPKNRIRGQLSTRDAMLMAADFFRQAAEICHERNCCIGLEHNPVEYGCDFVTNVADARELVDMVDHEGFRLHLDSAGIYMCGPGLDSVIRSAGEFVHYHISEPMLEPVADGEVDHALASKSLKESGYKGWVSIEMKMVPDKDILYRSVAKAVACYVE